jgi:hypothetical protein
MYVLTNFNNYIDIYLHCRQIINLFELALETE